MFGIIGVFINGLIGSLLISLPTLIKRLAISLGFGVVMFTGLQLMLDQIKDLAFSELDSMPALAANIIGILNIDTAFSIVMSAYAIRLSFKLMGGASPKQLRLL